MNESRRKEERRERQRLWGKKSTEGTEEIQGGEAIEGFLSTLEIAEGVN